MIKLELPEITITLKELEKRFLLDLKDPTSSSQKF
jgi:hypothetical protein